MADTLDLTQVDPNDIVAAPPGAIDLTTIDPSEIHSIDLTTVDPADIQAAPPAQGDSGFIAALTSGLKQSGPTAGQGLEAIGKTSGIDAITKAGQWFEEKTKPTVDNFVPKTWADIHGLGDVWTWIKEQAGAGVGSSAPMLASGLAGAGLGSMVAPGPGTAVGAVAGAASTAVPMNIGDAYQQFKSEGVDDDTAAKAGTAVGGIISIFDVGSGASLLKPLTGAGRKVISDIVVHTVADRIRHGMTVEAATEGLQQVIQEAAAQVLGGNATPEQRLENVVGSVIGGGLTGGLAEGASHLASKPGGSENPPPPPGAAGESAPETRSPAAGPAPVIPPGTVVGLAAPDGSIDRVVVQGVDKGVVFYQHPDGTTYGTPIEDFTPAVRPAPPAADVVRGDATTVPDVEERPAPPVTEGDINDFNPDEAMNKPAPVVPKPPSPQQKMALPDTEEITNTEKAAREYRKAAVQAQSIADAKSPQAKSAEEIAQMHRQADALDAEAVRLRQATAARSNTVGGTEAATEEARQRRAAGPLGTITEGVATGEPELTAPRQPLARMEAAVGEGPTGEPVLPEARRGLTAMEAATKAPGEPVLPEPRQPLAAMEAAVKGPTEASTGTSLTQPGSPAKRSEAVAPTAAPAPLLAATPKMQTLTGMIADRSAALNDPESIARVTGRSVDEVKAELASIAAKPNSPIRQVRGTVKVDKKTGQPVQSKMAGKLVYAPARTEPVSFAEALSAAGGVQDTDGELAARNAEKWHRGKPGKRSLVNPKGMPLDELGDWAEENGFLPKRSVTEATDENYHRDPADALKLLDRELAGKKQFAIDDESAVEQKGEPERTPEAEAAAREESVRADLKDLGETAPAGATLEDLEAQRGERLAMMDAASVEEAIRKMQAEQDAMDALLTPDELEEARRGSYEGDFAESTGQGEPEAGGVPESVAEPGAATGVEGQDEAAGGAPAEAERGVGEEGDVEQANAAATPDGQYEDRSSDLKAAVKAGQSVSEWLIGNGKRTGNEYIAATAPDGTVLLGGTSNMPEGVIFPAKTLPQLLNGASNLTLHHNHPQTGALSGTDLGVLPYPGIGFIVATSHSGEVSAAALTQDYIEAVSSPLGDESLVEMIHGISAAFDAASESLKDIEPNQLRRQELILRAMNEAGILEYHTTHKVPLGSANAISLAAKNVRKALSDAEIHLSFRIEDAPAGLYRPAVYRSASSAMAAVSRRVKEMAPRQFGGSTSNETGLRNTGDEEKRGVGNGDVDNRRSVRPDGDGTVRQVSGGHEATAAGRSGRDGGDQARQGTEGDGGGSAKEVSRAVNRSTNQGPIALRALGKIGNLISFAATVASKDRVSARYYTAEKAMARRAETLVREAADQTASYLSLPMESKDRIHAVLEHDRLAHLDRKPTGRRIAVRMPDNYAGELAKSGDVVTLNADESAALMDLRKFFDDRWDKFGAAMAKQFGWDGPFTEDDIKAAIASADSAKEKARGERAMEIYKMAEDMRRSGYTPFARYGDTKITVRPKPKFVPGKDGMQHFQPARVELVNAKSPIESLIGASGNTKSKTVTERVKELEKKYPRDKFDYEVRPLNSLEDLKKVDLPAVEKLFMVINSKDKDLGTKFFDEIVKQIYDERKAGFRKQSHNVAGYSPDFERAIADYIHSTSSTISRMENGKEVEDAFEATQKHEDQDVSKFWKDYREHIETPGDWTAGMRRIGFWAFIWGSPASAVSNLAQSPLVTMPQTASWAGIHAVPSVGRAISEAMGSIAVGRDGLMMRWDQIGKTPAERAMVAKLRAEGVLDPVISKDLQGAGKGTTPRERKIQRKFDRAYDIGASAFNAAEMANRVGAALSAFRLAQNPAVMAKAQKVYGRDAEFQEMVGPNGTPTDLARFMVDETQFIGGKRGQPRVMRGAGSLFLQWKQYQANWMRLLYKNMTRMGPEGKIAGTAMLAGLLVTSGLLGLPFAQDLADLYGWAYKKATGIDPLLERRIASMLNDAGLGDVGAETVLHGGSRSTIGIDLGSRLGMGNMAPDAGIENAFPLLGATLGRAGEVAERLKSGQPLGAAAALLPKGVQDVAKAAVVYPNEGLRTQRGDLTLSPSEITAGERFARATGFQPARFARLGDFKYSQRELKSATQEASTRLITNLASELAMAADARKSGDEAGVVSHTRQYLELLRDNAAELQDDSLPGWQKIPQPSARAIRSRLQSMLNFEPALMKQTSKLKRSEMQDYPLPKE